MRALACLLVLATPALAGAPRYHTYSVAVSGAVCPVGAPGIGPDGVEWGISLSALRGWTATLCPAVGQTFTGSGAIAACVYSAAPWGPGSWAFSPWVTFDLTGKTSALAHPCIELPHLETVVGLSDRVYLLPVAVGVSGGATLTIYLTGELR